MKYVKQLAPFEHWLCKNQSGTKAGLLGLDVGEVYVGLAMSDSSHSIATPFGVLQGTKTNFDLMVSDFQLLVAQYSLAGFVVCSPYDRNRKNSDGLMKSFDQNLSRTGKFNDVMFTYWNEGFTSKNVELLMKPLNLHPVDEKTILDKFAAYGILQEYLDYVNRKMKLDAELWD